LILPLPWCIAGDNIKKANQNGKSRLLPFDKSWAETVLSNSDSAQNRRVNTGSPTANAAHAAAFHVLCMHVFKPTAVAELIVLREELKS
jgi:hypothetical protein